MYDSLVSVLSHSDYREWMKEALQERSAVNSSYSLRAFARDLELSPASVSLILNGKKGLSKHTAERVARLLNFSADEQTHFKNLVVSKHGRTETERTLAKTQLIQKHTGKPIHVLPMDTFKVVSDWHHFGLLQLTSLKGFKSDPQWIASKLGVTLTETHEAISRLRRLGLLTKTPSGNLKAVKKVTFSKSDVPSSAMRKYHRQLIQKALQSIETQPVENRFLSSSVIPINKERLPHIIEKIRESVREIIESETCTSGKGTRVYGLTTQLFELSRSEEET